jgi:MFS-type transporter involved in bile tolerance (Atg22 family)
VSGKGASWLDLSIFGLAVHFTGSCRMSILAPVALLAAAGLVALARGRDRNRRFEIRSRSEAPTPRYGF